MPTPSPALDITERIDPNWGSCYGGATYLADGVQVWMHRRGQKVRFFDVRGVQVGPEQANVFPAICWAARQGWYDLDLSPADNDRMHREVA